MLENMLRLFYNFPISFFTILLQGKKKKRILYQKLYNLRGN